MSYAMENAIVRNIIKELEGFGWSPTVEFPELDGELDTSKGLAGGPAGGRVRREALLHTRTKFKNNSPILGEY